MVRSVTKQVEPEYDDATRNLIEGLQRHDVECCPGCGMHKSVTDHMDQHHFTFEEQVCESCATQARYARVVADRDHERTPKDQHGHPNWDSPRTPRPDDGRHIFLRRMTAEELEQRRRDGAQGIGRG